MKKKVCFWSQVRKIFMVSMVAAENSIIEIVFENSIIEIVFERLHKLKHLKRKCKYRRVTGLTDYDVVLSN